MATETRDGHCDILEAVAAATAGHSVGDCANSNSVSRVALRPGSTYPVRKTLRLTGGVEIGIADGTTGRATISAAEGFAVDPRYPATSCLVFAADAKPQVWLRDVTLTQDPSLTLIRRLRHEGHAQPSPQPASPAFRRAASSRRACRRRAAITRRTPARRRPSTCSASLVDGNRSTGKGGGISSEGSGASMLVAHSAIVNNAADNDGGGIYLGGGWGTDIIASTTISGNTTSGVGGGLLVRFAEETNTYVHILTSTIANNIAAGTGGGIEFQPPQVGVHDVTVFSSIVAGNSPVDDAGMEHQRGLERGRRYLQLRPGLVHLRRAGASAADQHGIVHVRRSQPVPGPAHAAGRRGRPAAAPAAGRQPGLDGAIGETGRDDQRNSWIDNLDPGQPAEWTVFDTLGDGDGDGTAVRDLGAYERNDRWQTELLAVRAQGPASHSIVTIPGGYDRGAGTAYAAASATNELVTYALPVAEAGRYDVSIGARLDPDAGKFQVAIANDPAGPWTPLGGEQDGYASVSGFASLGPFPTPLFASPGEKLVRFSVTGKNPASAGHKLYLDFIQLKRRTAACPVADIAAGGSTHARSCPGAASAAGAATSWPARRRR